MYNLQFEDMASLRSHYLLEFQALSDKAIHLSPRMYKTLEDNLYKEYSMYFKLLTFNDKFDCKIAIKDHKLTRKEIVRIRKNRLKKLKEKQKAKLSIKKPKKSIIDIIKKFFINLFKKKEISKDKESK